MKFTIREAQAADMPAVMALINELAIFEREADQVEIGTEDLVRDGFGENPLFHCFVAEADGQIQGIALTYWRYSTWKGQTLHLEDLIVTESARGTGLGNALLSTVIHFGHQNGCKRIQWEVLDWNENAIRFYESKGAIVLRDWHVVQLREEAIARFVETI